RGLSSLTWAFKGVGTGAGAAAGSVDKLYRAINATAGTIFVIERLGRAFNSAVIQPIADIAQEMLDATEASRKFEASLSGVMGMVAAKDLNRSINKAARSSPATVEGLRDSATALAVNPTLSARLTFGDTAQATKAVEEYERLVRRLAVLSPEQGVAGGQVAVRELVEGGGAQAVSSLKRRFGINLTQLARSVADEFQGNMERALSSVGNDPAVAIRALEKYTSTFVGPEVEAKLAGLVSTKMTKLRESFRQGLATIGDSGIFDALVEKLTGATSKLLAYLDSPAFAGQAARISKSLERVLSNVSKTLAGFLKSVSGSKDDADGVAGLVEHATKAIEALGSASDGLPELGRSLGSGFRQVAEAVEKAAAELGVLGEAMGGGAKGMVGGWFKEKYLRLAPEAREAERLGQLVKVLETYGLGGAKVGTRDADRGAGAVIDTSGIAGGTARQALAEKMIAAWGDAGVDLATTARPLKLQSILRERIADFDGKLAAALGRATAPVVVAQPRDPGKPPAGVPQSVFDLVKAEDSGPNFRARSKAINSLVGQVESPENKDPLADLLRSGNGVFTSSLSGDPAAPLRIGDALGAMSKQYRESVDKFDKALADGAAAMAAGGDKHLADLLTALSGTRDRVEAGYKAAMTEVGDGLRESAKNFGVRLADSLDDAPAFVSRGLYGRISEGRTSYSDKAADVATRAGLPFDRAAIGFDGLPLDQRQKLARRMADAGLKDADDAGTYGRLTVGLDAAGVRDALSRRLDDRDVDLQKLGGLRDDAIPRQGKVLDSAVEKYRQDPSNELNAKNLGAAEAEYGRLLDLADKLDLKLDGVRAGAIQFGTDVRDALESSIGKGIVDLIEGTGSLKDAMVGFARDVVQAFSQMASRNLIQGLIGSAGQTQANGSAGNLGGVLGALVSGIGSYFGGGATTTTQAMADGGVFQGGLRYFASGGVVNAGSPVIGIVGEGTMNDSIIPRPDGKHVPIVYHDDGAYAVLPGGRMIPARVDDRRSRGMYASAFADGGVVAGGFSAVGAFGAGGAVQGAPGGQFGSYSPAAGGGGGGDGGGNVYVVNSPEAAFAQGFKAHKDKLVDLVAGNVVKGGKIAKAINRPRR
ncbi:MAG: hypothetical protein JWO31_906, partial [Phycisphaerales bacterium]|nr:hypothetical protein [Phycisphaerales bacterium]